MFVEFNENQIRSMQFPMCIVAYEYNIRYLHIHSSCPSAFTYEDSTSMPDYVLRNTSVRTQKHVIF